jgi:hypothetical protein
VNNISNSQGTTEMAVATHDGFRALVGKRKTARVPLSSGEVCIVQSLTTRELAMHEAGFLDKEGKKIPKTLLTYRERWAIAACVDESGRKLFTDADMEWLRELPACDLDAIVAKATELSSAGKDCQEDLAGRFATPPCSNSGCDSPSHSEDGTGGNSSTK